MSTSNSQPHAGASSTRLHNFIVYDSDYRHLAWLTILAVAAIDWIWAWRAGLTIAGVMPVAVAVAVLAAIGSIYSVTGRDRMLADLGHYTALWFALAVTINLYSYMVATLRFPMRDAEFARMDAALGFDWLACLGAIAPHQVFQFLLGYAYNSFYLQIIFSIVFFAVTTFKDRNREMFWVGLSGALITVTLSGLVPALGPYVKNDIPKWSAILLAIRNGSLTNIRIAEMQGIVAFPSFHTVLAMMLIYAHRPPSWTFLPIAALNLLMLIAIPFAGHHYLVDVLAGIAVTAVSIKAVRLMEDETAASG